MSKLKVGKGAKKYTRRNTPSLDAASILRSSLQFRSMIMDMHENLGVIPNHPAAKQAIDIEKKLRYNMASDGYAAYVAKSILTGTAEPNYVDSPGFRQALMHFMICQIAEIVEEADELKMHAALVHTLNWTLRSNVDPAIAIAVAQFALSAIPEHIRVSVIGSEPHTAYIERYGLVLKELPAVRFR